MASHIACGTSSLPMAWIVSVSPFSAALHHISSSSSFSISANRERDSTHIPGRGRPGRRRRQRALGAAPARSRPGLAPPGSASRRDSHSVLVLRQLPAKQRSTAGAESARGGGHNRREGDVITRRDKGERGGGQDQQQTRRPCQHSLLKFLRPPMSSQQSTPRAFARCTFNFE